MNQYRDGVFSVSSPAPRYGTLSTAFENGSLGSLEDDAAALLNPALNAFAVGMAAAVSPVGGGGRGGAAGLSGSAAVNLARDAASTEDIPKKLVLTIAAAYAASHFGLPQNNLLPLVGQVCDSFVMTGNQRAALHQQALAVYKVALRQQQDLERRSQALLEKGNVMSGVFRDGVLGGAFQDGVLGAVYRDGSLGATTRMSARAVRYAAPRVHAPQTTAARQQRQVQDGSLGSILSERAVRDGSLGDVRSLLSPRSRPAGGGGAATSSLFAKKARRLSGLGCGCAGIGAGAETAPIVGFEQPFYKTPLFIGGAAAALGVVIYALKRK